MSADDRRSLLDAFKDLRVTDVCDGMDWMMRFDTGLVDPAIRPLWRTRRQLGGRAGPALVRGRGNADPLTRRRTDLMPGGRSWRLLELEAAGVEVSGVEVAGVEGRWG